MECVRSATVYNQSINVSTHPQYHLAPRVRVGAQDEAQRVHHTLPRASTPARPSPRPSRAQHTDNATHPLNRPVRNLDLVVHRGHRGERQGAEDEAQQSAQQHRGRGWKRAAGGGRAVWARRVASGLNSGCAGRREGPGAAAEVVTVQVKLLYPGAKRRRRPSRSRRGHASHDAGLAFRRAIITRLAPFNAEDRAEAALIFNV